MFSLPELSSTRVKGPSRTSCHTSQPGSWMCARPHPSPTSPLAINKTRWAKPDNQVLASQRRSGSAHSAPVRCISDFQPRRVFGFVALRAGILITWGPGRFDCAAQTQIGMGQRRPLRRSWVRSSVGQRPSTVFRVYVRGVAICVCAFFPKGVSSLRFSRVVIGAINRSVILWDDTTIQYSSASRRYAVNAKNGSDDRE